MTEPNQPANPANHAAHDPTWMAALATRDPDLSPAERTRAQAALESCGPCADLFADLVAISAAIPSAAIPARPRDFTLTAADAARLQPRGLRRLLKAIGSARDGVTFPLAMGLTTMGIAGLMLATIPSALSGAGGGATSDNLSAVGEAAPMPAPHLRGSRPPHPRLLPPRLRAPRRPTSTRSAQPRPPRRPAAARSSPATTAMPRSKQRLDAARDAAGDPRRCHGAFGAPGRGGDAAHRRPGVVPPPLHRPPPLERPPLRPRAALGLRGFAHAPQCARSPAHPALPGPHRRPLRACAGTICGRRPGLARNCRRPPRRHPEAKPWNA